MNKQDINKLRLKTLSRTLYSLMGERQLNQSDVSRKTGVPQPTISRLLSEASTPRVAALQDIAEYFNVSVTYLLTGNSDGNKAENNASVNPKDKIGAVAKVLRLLKR